MYADYDFYTQVYRGGLITEAAFDELSERASDFLDLASFGRVDSASHDLVYANKIKKACCAVAEAIAKNREGGDLSSETQGKYSRVFVRGAMAGGYMSDAVRQYNAAASYLLGTGLLYRGVG